jgi:hypothetical protein
VAIDGHLPPNAQKCWFSGQKSAGASVGWCYGSNPDRNDADLAHPKPRRLNGFSSPARA